MLKQKYVKDVIKLLGIKNIKEVKTNEIVSKNIKVALATLSKIRSCVEKDARRELLTGVLQKELLQVI